MSTILKAALALGLLLPTTAPAMAAPIQTFELQLAQATPSELPEGVNLSDKTERQGIERHTQLQLHQGVALASLASMALTTALGVYTTNYAPSSQFGTVRNLHMALGGMTTGLYLTAATLAVTAPRGYDVEDEGPLDSVSLHRDLAWLHAAGMLATVTMGMLTSIGKLEPWQHGVVGGTTLGLMTLSAGVIILDF